MPSFLCTFLNNITTFVTSGRYHEYDSTEVLTQKTLSAQELAHFERIRRQFEQQDASARNTQSNPSTRPTPNHNTSHPVQSFPLRPKPPPPKRSDTAVPIPTTNNSHPHPHSDTRAHKSKGKGKAAVIANPDSGPENEDADIGEELADDDEESEESEESEGGEDDYVIRTGVMNGQAKNVGQGGRVTAVLDGVAGKDKGKAAAVDGFHEVEEDGEELYD
ncbi:MAG: hypothetical protein Q9227_004251 [Pyrenula ochraceoflavens]